MNTHLVAALRKKFKTPQAALEALGLDESLLAEDSTSKETSTMSTIVLSRKALLVQGASMGYLAGKLAVDAKPTDLTKVFEKVTTANFKQSKPAIIQGLKEATTGKLAKDVNLDDFTAFLGAFDEVEPAEEKVVEETDEEMAARLAKSAKDKAAKDKAAKDKAAKDAEENPFPPKKEDEEEPDAEKKAADMKIAMDAAISAAAKSTETRIRASMKAAREAEAFVRPWVGELAVAYDSAEEIYRSVAVSLKIPDAETIHESALRSLITLMPKPGDQRLRLASDSTVRTADAEADFRKRFPDARAPRRI